LYLNQFSVHANLIIDIFKYAFLASIIMLVGLVVKGNIIYKGNIMYKLVIVGLMVVELYL